jgi:hypothetical protein
MARPNRRARYAAKMILWIMLALLALSSACKTSTDCSCVVDQSGDHRVLACGDTQCVGGTPFTCTDGTSVALSGACTVTPPPGAGSSGGTPDSGSTVQDHSCDDLGSFCQTSCRKPQSVNSDCLSTAGTGDPVQCAQWQSSNAVLCSP